MPAMREHFGYISGSVNSSKGTFSHNLGKTPWAVLVCPTGATAGTPTIKYDSAASSGSNVVLVAGSSTYETFTAVLILQRPAG